MQGLGRRCTDGGLVKRSWQCSALDRELCLNHGACTSGEVLQNNHQNMKVCYENDNQYFGVPYVLSFEPIVLIRKWGTRLSKLRLC